MSTLSFSDLKSVNRSLEMTWSKSGVSALYICAWAEAFGPGVPYWPEGRMFRAMIVGSAFVWADAAGARAKIADAIAATATHTLPCASRAFLSPLSLAHIPERDRDTNELA